MGVRGPRPSGRLPGPGGGRAPAHSPRLTPAPASAPLPQQTHTPTHAVMGPAGRLTLESASSRQREMTVPRKASCAAMMWSRSCACCTWFHSSSQEHSSTWNRHPGPRESSQEHSSTWNRHRGPEGAGSAARPGPGTPRRAAGPRCRADQDLPQR